MSRLLFALFISLALNGITQEPLYFTGFTGGLSWLVIADGETYENKPGFAYGAGIGRDFLVCDKISVAVEMTYMRSGAGFMNRYDISAIPEDFYHFRHRITMHSLNLPLMVKFHPWKAAGKSPEFYAGTALKYLFHNSRETEIVKTSMNDPGTEEITPLNAGKTTLETGNGSRIGFSGLAGIGKDIKAGMLDVYLTARFQFDLNKWRYETVDDPAQDEFRIRQQAVVAGVGIRF